MELSREELKEVMAIFRAESSQYIQELNDGLIALEKGANDEALIATLFRTAHSIKGAARMLGLLPIEKLAHKLEDILGLVKKGEKIIAASEYDVLYTAVDTIAKVTEELSEGGQLQTDIAAIDADLEKLCSGAGSDSQVATSKPKDDLEVTKTTSEEKTEGQVEESSKEPDAKNLLLDWQKDQNIRIHTAKLDTLFNRSSELITALSKEDELGNLLRDLTADVQKWKTEWGRHKGIWDLLEYNIDEYANLPSPSAFTDEQLQRIFALIIDNHRYLRSISNKSKEILQLFQDDSARKRFIIENLESEVKDIRMLPISHLFKLLPRMVRDIAKVQNKEVDIALDGLDTQVDKKVIEELKDPLIHILRNAIDHGLEKREERKEAGKTLIGSIQLNARYEGSSVVISVSDDGRGIDADKIAEAAIKKKLVTLAEVKKMSVFERRSIIFMPGFSTARIITDISGRGVGLDVVRANVERLKGRVDITSEPGQGTTVKLQLPLTLSTTQVLLFIAQKQTYAIPVQAISRLLRIQRQDLSEMADKIVLDIDDEAVLVTELRRLLGETRPLVVKQEKVRAGLLQQFTTEESKLPVIVVESLNRRIGIIVDQLIDEQAVVIKGFGERLKQIDKVMGVAVLSNGELANVLDPNTLISSSQALGQEQRTRKKKVVERKSHKVLIVDDSITTRTLEKNILESAGFDVQIAINGREAWSKLKAEAYDLLVSDIEMPEMDGFELIEKVRNDSDLAQLPSILVTSLQSPKDRQRGIEVGADAYITKGTFDQKKLLETINSILAEE
jgi:two-component system chemotaxis sensor kinase CheA